MEALWLHQSHNVVDEALLKRMLRSPDFHARAAATRVLCYWRDRVPDALDLLRRLAADPAPRVRLEAVRAASFFTAPEAVEGGLISADQPTDEDPGYVRTGAMAAPDESVVFDLVRLLTSRGGKELAEVRPDLEKMAAGAKTPVTRQLGYAALVAADGNADKAWALALKSAPALQDLVSAMPLIRD